jgi:hypothetical protein
VSRPTDCDHVVEFDKNLGGESAATMKKTLSERNYWVWITKPEYYLDQDGRDSGALQPSADEDTGRGWWTCHKDTRAGDLVLLYRTRPKSDIAYLIEAKSDAEIHTQDPPEGCIFQNQFKALMQQACDANPELERLRKHINEHDSLCQESDARCQAILSRAVTESDRDLRREWEGLGKAGDQAKDRELRLILEEAGDRDPIPEAIIKSVLSRTRPIWEELDERFAEFRKRAEAEGGLFQEYLGVSLETATLFEKHDQLLKQFDEQVFSFAGLPNDTIVEDDPGFADSFVCDWEPRFKFESPLALQILKKDVFLTKEWNALRASFKGRVFRCEPQIWEYLISLASSDNQGLAEVMTGLQAHAVSPDIVSEKSIEDYLRDHLEVLLPQFELDLYRHFSGRDGQQFPCPEAGGYIDLLCVNRETGDFVVVELKAKRAGRDVAGQIKTYMGWVGDKLAGGKDVHGLIISRGLDKKLHFALKDMPKVQHMDLSHFWPPK